MADRHSPAAFQATDAVLVRATTYDSTLILPEPPTPTASVNARVSWLHTIWAQPAVREVLQVASADLAAQIERALADIPLARAQPHLSP